MTGRPCPLNVLRGLMRRLTQHLAAGPFGVLIPIIAKICAAVDLRLLGHPRPGLGDKLRRGWRKLQEPAAALQPYLDLLAAQVRQGFGPFGLGNFSDFGRVGVGPFRSVDRMKFRP